MLNQEIKDWVASPDCEAIRLSYNTAQACTRREKAIKYLVYLVSQEEFKDKYIEKLEALLDKFAAQEVSYGIYD